MKQARIWVGVAIPRTGALRWHRLLLDSLGDCGVAVRLDEAAQAHSDTGHPVPLPWRALLPLERLLARPRPDLLAGEDIPAIPLTQARPDILVLTPGASASPDLAQELLQRLPWGVLEIETVWQGVITPPSRTTIRSWSYQDTAQIGEHTSELQSQR